MLEKERWLIIVFKMNMRGIKDVMTKKKPQQDRQKFSRRKLKVDNEKKDEKRSKRI